LHMAYGSEDAAEFLDCHQPLAISHTLLGFTWD